MTYFKSVLIAIDQLGNAIAGGNPDCTISGRTGYYQYNAVKGMRWYWQFLAFVIDLTFWPFDSHHHCREAYLKEKDEEFYHTTNVIALFLLSLITIVSCAILIVPFYLIYLVKMFIQWNKNRNQLKSK